MLLRDSGDRTATGQAIEKFEAALIEAPNDHIAIHVLAHMLDRKGQYLRVIALLEPLLKHRSGDARQRAATLLLRAYERTDDTLKTAELRRQFGL